MVWNRLVQLILGTAVVAAQSHAPTETPVMIDEYLAHQCALKVAHLSEESSTKGPVFALGSLALTSTLARDGSQLLILASSAGTYVIKLPYVGVNRIRFSLPNSLQSGSVEYFLSYSHSPTPRVFEFSSPRPPMNREDLDYYRVSAQRSPQLITHLNYAILETTTRIQAKFIDVESIVHNCDHMQRTSPQMAQVMRKNLVKLNYVQEIVGLRMVSRGPASLSQ